MLHSIRIGQRDLGSGCATDLDVAVWRGGGHARLYVSGRAEGGADAVDGSGMQRSTYGMGNTGKFYGDAATDEEVKSSSRKSA